MKKKCLRIALIVGSLVAIIAVVIGAIVLNNMKKAQYVYENDILDTQSICTLDIPIKELKKADTLMQMQDLYYEYDNTAVSDVVGKGYLFTLQEWFNGLILKKEVKREDVLKDISDDSEFKGYWIEPYIYCECNGKTYLYKEDEDLLGEEDDVSLKDEVWYEVSNPTDPIEAINASINHEEDDDCYSLNGKPVIYLYPEEETQVDVTLDVAGEFTYTYPKYEDGWSVIASPDGTLKDVKTGDEYSYLFWESTTQAQYDMSEGFVVKGSDSTEFLKEKLSYMGLTPKEYNEFIVYWAPILEQNEYNLIKFAGEEYENDAKLTISPQPDSMLRVFMVYEPLEEPIEVKEQELKTFEREGFTVVEWGGRILG